MTYWVNCETAQTFVSRAFLYFSFSTFLTVISLFFLSSSFTQRFSISPSFSIYISHLSSCIVDPHTPASLSSHIASRLSLRAPPAYIKKPLAIINLSLSLSQDATIRSPNSSPSHTAHTSSHSSSSSPIYRQSTTQYQSHLSARS